MLGDTNDDEAHYKDMVDRDERRWKRADKNEDGALTEEEFMDFLHPEEAENMKDIVVEVLFHFEEVFLFFAIIYCKNMSTVMKQTTCK